MKVVRVYRLGRVPYARAWRWQKCLAEKIARNEHPPALLLLEHPHTYTLGRQGHVENLLWDEEERQRRGVALFQVDRGGDVTYHGPGQLVGYPLLPLGRVDANQHLPQADYVGYIRRLEEVLIQALRAWEIESFRIDGKTGVWVTGNDGRPAKIAAIGIKVDVHGISRHGFALNLAPDMAYWQGIIGCGLKDDTVTSLAALLSQPPAMSALQMTVVRAFARVFSVTVREGEPLFDFCEANL